MCEQLVLYFFQTMFFGHYLQELLFDIIKEKVLGRVDEAESEEVRTLFVNLRKI